jgi:hypothetical protein
MIEQLDELKTELNRRAKKNIEFFEDSEVDCIRYIDFGAYDAIDRGVDGLEQEYKALQDKIEKESVKIRGYIEELKDGGSLSISSAHELRKL